MKIINSNKSRKQCGETEVFVDPVTKVQNGFVGNAMVYDQSIYIDTRDGTGYDKVIEKLGALIYKFSNKYHFNNNSFEDTKHDVIIHILEGIPKYNSNRNAKLSTFLEMRVSIRLYKLANAQKYKCASKNIKYFRGTATILNITDPDRMHPAL